MTATEAERHDLREELRDVLPEGAVRTLMDSLPPMDWREFATKTDLAALEERLDTRFERVDARIDKRIAKQTYVILVGTMATLAAALTPIYLALFSGGAG